VSSILLTFGSLVFLISGAHQAVLAAYLKSYEIAPVGMFRASHEVGTLLVTSTGKIFQVAVQMAAPLVAVNFIISLTFSILGKAAPAVQVFSESFAVRIVVGLFVLGMTLQLVSQLLLEQLRLAPDLMLRLVP
jgi:flagellar biosynthetic protein FliR